jgi:hypothetical protein
MIREKIDELNWERKDMAEQQERLLGRDQNKETGKYDVPRTKDMVMEDGLVSDEMVERPYLGRNYFIDRRCLDSIQSSAVKIRHLDEEISKLCRLKIRLFGDVDFPGGRDTVKSILKEFAETETRLKAKADREREQARLMRERHKRRALNSFRREVEEP